MAKFPWNEQVFKDWDVGVINHYYQNGKRHIFVLMTKGGKCIKVEGSDEEEVFDKLAIKAMFEN